MKMIAKPADGGVVRHFMIQAESAKVAEGYAVLQIIGKLTVGKPVPGLQQQRLEHPEGRIGRIAGRVRTAVKVLLQVLLYGPPVDNLVYLVCGLGPALATQRRLIRKTALMIEPGSHQHAPQYRFRSLYQMVKLI